MQERGTCTPSTRCPRCGHLVDNRDLEEVFDHLDPHRVFPWRVIVRRVWRFIVRPPLRYD